MTATYFSMLDIECDSKPCNCQESDMPDGVKLEYSYLENGTRVNATYVHINYIKCKRDALKDGWVFMTDGRVMCPGCKVKSNE